MPLSSALSQLHILLVVSEMCPLKLTDFCLFLYHRSYTILQGPLIPLMAFTCCHDWSLNLLPPDGRASTRTTRPIRLAFFCLVCLDSPIFLTLWLIDRTVLAGSITKAKGITIILQIDQATSGYLTRPTYNPVPINYSYGNIIPLRSK